MLVNNAGGQFQAPAEDITPNGWSAVRRLNLDAPWYLTQQVAKRWMIENGGGRIISVVLCPTRGIALMAHSSAARAGTEALARVLSVEWGKYNIGVVCVAPGLDRHRRAPSSTAATWTWWPATSRCSAWAPPRRSATRSPGWRRRPPATSPGTTIVIDGGMENTVASSPEMR